MSLLRLMRRDPSRICPYYTRGKKCATGCWSEPSCITDEPMRGWPWQRLLNRSLTVIRCNGILSTIDGQAECGRTDMRHRPHTVREEL